MATLLLNELGQSMQIIDGDIFDKKTTVSVTVAELMKTSLKLIQSPILSLQLGAFCGLRHVVIELVKRDKAMIQVENFDPKSLNIWKFGDTLATMQHLVDALLRDYK